MSVLQPEQINPLIQKELFRKIDGLNRVRIGSNPNSNQGANFFTEDILEPTNTSNPIEQQLVRNCWAKVSAAIEDPDRPGLDGLGDQPVSFSSYISGDGSKQSNRPLAFNKSPFKYSNKDIWRGETGITNISVNMKGFFIKNISISFSCPDPIDFEERIQPIFLRHGQFVAVEFGWGTLDNDIKIPELSVDDINNLNNSIIARNLQSAGNYQVEAGVVTNYSYDLDTNGGYTGTIELVTRGQNVLNATSQGSSNVSNEVISLKRHIGDIKKIADAKIHLKDDPDKSEVEEYKRLSKKKENARKELENIHHNKVTFTSTMLNLDKVVKDYLKDTEKKTTYSIVKTKPTGINIVDKVQLAADMDETVMNSERRLLKTGKVNYKAKNGAMWLHATEPIQSIPQHTWGAIKTGWKTIWEGSFWKSTPPGLVVEALKRWKRGGEEYQKSVKQSGGPWRELWKDGVENWKQEKYQGVDGFTDKSFVSWGWFEDFILNSFFSIETDKLEIQSIRSTHKHTDGKGKTFDQSNKCHVATHLYTKGLDSVVLPGSHHESFDDEFEQVDVGIFRKRKRVEHKKTRGSGYAINEVFLTKKDVAYQVRVRDVFKIMNENFQPFRNQVQTYSSEILEKDPDVSWGNRFSGYQMFTDEHIENPEKFMTMGGGDHGYIRNMVFPTALLKKHFTNMKSLKEGLRSFWAEVSNHYGGFWQFGLLQDHDTYGRIGVVDLFMNSEAENLDQNDSFNWSERKDYINYDYAKAKKQAYDDSGLQLEPKASTIFTFPLYSKDSFIKDFNMNVRISAEASTLAAYGGNSNIATGTNRSTDIQNLSLQAYSLLLTKHRDAIVKGDLDNDILKKNLVDLIFPIDDDGKGLGTSGINYNSGINKNSGAIQKLDDEYGINFEKVPGLDDDIEKIKEKLESPIAKDNKIFYYWYDPNNTHGVRFYNNQGNMKAEYLRTMLHSINNSFIVDDKSNITTRKVIIPIELNMTLDGVGGLKPFDLFRVDYIPKVYREFTYFQIMSVSHDISSAGWETKVRAFMKVDMKKFLDKYGQDLLISDLSLSDMLLYMKSKEHKEQLDKASDEYAEFRKENISKYQERAYKLRDEWGIPENVFFKNTVVIGGVTYGGGDASSAYLTPIVDSLGGPERVLENYKQATFEYNGVKGLYLLPNLPFRKIKYNKDNWHDSPYAVIIYPDGQEVPYNPNLLKKYAETMEAEAGKDFTVFPDRLNLDHPDYRHISSGDYWEVFKKLNTRDGDGRTWKRKEAQETYSTYGHGATFRVNVSPDTIIYKDRFNNEIEVVDKRWFWQRWADPVGKTPIEAPIEVIDGSEPQDQQPNIQYPDWDDG